MCVRLNYTVASPIQGFQPRTFEDLNELYYARHSMQPARGAKELSYHTTWSYRKFRFTSKEARTTKSFTIMCSIRDYSVVAHVVNILGLLFTANNATDSFTSLLI